MMKGWLALLGIAGVGFGVGFFAGERYGEQKKEKELKKEIPEQTSPQEENPAKELGYIPEEEPEDPDPDKTQQEMDEYLSRFESPSEEDEEEEELDDEAVEIEESCEPLIELFFDEDRWVSETDYSCYELFYWTEDEVFTDEDDHRVEFVEDMIGEHALPVLLESGQNSIYARNSWAETFYKITLKYGSYAETILGMSPPTNE